MKYIKKFEELDFSQTLPFTSKDQLTMYYSCDNCDNTWKSLNKQCDKCDVCNSDEIEELSKNEWYEVVKSRSDEDDDEEFIVGLDDLDKINNRRNVN